MGEVEVARLPARTVDERHVAVGDVRRVADPPVGRVARRRHLVGVLLEQPVDLRGVPVEQAVLPGRDEPRRDRVTGHDVGLHRAVLPARRPAALLAGPQQRDRLVARLLRREHRQQLDLRAGTCPTARSSGSTPPRPPGAAPSRVPGNDRRRRCRRSGDEGPVERGVERAEVVGRSPGRLDLAEPLRPGGAGRGPDGVEGAGPSAARFFSAPAASTYDSDVVAVTVRSLLASKPNHAPRSPAPSVAREPGVKVEPAQVPVVANGREKRVTKCRVYGVVDWQNPCPGHRRLDGAVVDDGGLRAGDGVQRLPGVDQDRASEPAGKCSAASRCAWSR